MSRFVAALLFLFLGLGCSKEAYGPTSTTSPLIVDTRTVGLDTPDLKLGIGIETGDATIHWGSIAGATQYTIERDMVPTFPGPSRFYTGPEISYWLGYGSEYPWTFYCRVRAENPEHISNWSNAVWFPW